MYEFTVVDLQDGERVEAGVSDAGTQMIALLLRAGIEARHESLPGPVVADVMRVVTGLERIV